MPPHKSHATLWCLLCSQVGESLRAPTPWLGLREGVDRWDLQDPKPLSLCPARITKSSWKSLVGLESTDLESESDLGQVTSSAGGQCQGLNNTMQ